MKRQKNMKKIILALSSALTTCLLLLQYFSFLALKIMPVMSQLSYIASEAVLSRNNAIAQFKRMKSRSSRPEVFLTKGVLKICSKFTREHPCRTAISIKLQSSFIEITLRHGCSPVNLLHIFRTLFLKNTSGWLLLEVQVSHDFEKNNLIWNESVLANTMYQCFTSSTKQLNLKKYSPIKKFRRHH